MNQEKQTKQKKKQLWVNPQTHHEVMLFKVQSKAKDVDSVINQAIKLLKEKINEELNGEGNTNSPDTLNSQSKGVSER